MIRVVNPQMDRTLLRITAISRMRVCLLLPLLLLLSQHGAWLHELSHAAYSANLHQVMVQQGNSATEGGVCPSCQSFGQLGSALTGSHRIVVAPHLNDCPIPEPQYSQPNAQLPALRNRGPPHLA